MKTKHLVLIILAVVSLFKLFTNSDEPTFIDVISLVAFYLLIIASIVYIVQHWNDRLN